MFKTLSKFWLMLEMAVNMFLNLFSAGNNLTIAADTITSIVIDRSDAVKLEQQEENKQRLAYIKAKTEHNKNNPETFDFN